MDFIGIDPGVGGGIAVVKECRQEGNLDEMRVWRVKLLKMKDATERDIFDWVDENCLTPGFGRQFIQMAVIERVSSSPQMGVCSAFTFGRSYGFLRGMLIGLRVPFEEVSPQKWQKALACMTKGDKNVSKDRAQQLFPNEKITHAVADALLLAEYARRTYARPEVAKA